MTLLAIAALAVTACQKTDKVEPTAEFAQTLYNLELSGSVDIQLNVSPAPQSALTVPVTINGGTAGTDFTVSSTSFSVPAGATSATITLSDKNLAGGSSLTLKISDGVGYKAGTKATSVVSVAKMDPVTYSFNTASATLYEKANLTLNLGSPVQKEVRLPVVLEGDGAASISCDKEIVIPGGAKTARLTLKMADMEFSGEKTVKVKLTVPDYFVAGEIPEVTVTLKEAQIPAKLVGTWAFEKVFDEEEYLLWFEEEKDDPELVPVNNEGFTLTFAENEDGDIVLTPGGNGDFSAYFREAVVTLATPMNTTSDAELVGEFAAMESNMFMADEGIDSEVNTYYTLSVVNRAFSPETETLGPAVIAICLDGDHLYLQFRDMDQPPFGEMWWDDAHFDPDMFGVASLFIRQE